MPQLLFDRLDPVFPKTEMALYRARVPGGWLVATRSGTYGSGSITFVPDPQHVWDGGTAPA